MMEMVQQRKQLLQKKGKKGFTLVELIVVIVILGILAAIAVPALVGYIQKAQDDGAKTEGATARTAIQSVISDASAHPTGVANEYAYTYGTTTVKFTINPTTGAVAETSNTILGAINNLTGVTYTNLSDIVVTPEKAVDSFKIHVPGSDRNVTLETGGKTWTVS